MDFLYDYISGENAQLNAGKIRRRLASIFFQRVGCKAEKKCIMQDESRVLQSDTQIKKNNLPFKVLVPGLFVWGDYATLMTQSKEDVQREGFKLDSVIQLDKQFTLYVMHNLQNVFSID